MLVESLQTPLTDECVQFASYASLTWPSELEVIFLHAVFEPSGYVQVPNSPLVELLVDPLLPSEEELESLALLDVDSESSELVSSSDVCGVLLLPAVVSSLSLQEVKLIAKSIMIIKCFI
jgi:hypothetical protein